MTAPAFPPAAPSVTRGRALAVSALGVLAATMASAAYLVLYVYVRRHVMGKLAWDHHDLVAHAPFAFGAVFALAGIALVPLVLARPALGARFALAVYAAISVVSAMIMFPRIAQWSSLVLALGAGVQAWRAIGSDGARMMRIARRGAFVTSAVYALLLATTLIGRVVDRRGDGGNTAATAGAPDVILLIWDTVRAAEVSTYGYSVETTPNLTALAKEGALFERSFANAPWTLTSHAAMFTGRNAGEVTADWETPLDESPPTLAEVLRSAGYETRGFNGNAFYGGSTTGLARGFDNYQQYRRSWRQVLYTSTFGQTVSGIRVIKSPSLWSFRNALTRPRLAVQPVFAEYDTYFAQYATNDFLKWTAARDTTRPYFAFLNYYDAHETESIALRAKYTALGGKTRKERYDLAIRDLDAQLGRIVQGLRERGTLDRTILIVTSDHGEHFGEHGITYGHGVSLYDATLRVPLVVRYPRAIPAGTRVAARVQLKQLGATILSLAKIASPFPGRSLMEYAGSAAPTDTILSEVSRRINETRDVPNRDFALKRLMTDSVTYIRRGDGREELYAHRIDPEEKTNLADSASFAATRDALRRRVMGLANPWR